MARQTSAGRAGRDRTSRARAQKGGAGPEGREAVSLVAVLPDGAETAVLAGEARHDVEVVGLRGVDHRDRVHGGEAPDRPGFAARGLLAAGELERVVVDQRCDAERETGPLNDPLRAGGGACRERAGLLGG